MLLFEVDSLKSVATALVTSEIPWGDVKPNKLLLVGWLVT